MSSSWSVATSPASPSTPSVCRTRPPSSSPLTASPASTIWKAYRALCTKTLSNRRSGRSPFAVLFQQPASHHQTHLTTTSSSSPSHPRLQKIRAVGGQNLSHACLKPHKRKHSSLDSHEDDFEEPVKRTSHSCTADWTIYEDPSSSENHPPPQLTRPLQALPCHEEEGDSDEKENLLIQMDLQCDLGAKPNPIH